MTGEPLNQRPADVPAHPVPEVEGPNSTPTGSRFDTSTESYAAGWPDTPTVTESAKRAKARIQQIGDELLQKLQEPGAIEGVDKVFRRGQLKPEIEPSDIGWSQIGDDEFFGN